MSQRLLDGWRRIQTAARGSALGVAGLRFRKPVLLEELLDEPVLGTHVSHQGQLGLALEVALWTLVRRSAWKTLCQLLVEVLSAVVVVQHAGVGEDLTADLERKGNSFNGGNSAS